MFEYFRLVDPERNFEDIKEEIQDLKDLNKLDKGILSSRASRNQQFAGLDRF